MIKLCVWAVVGHIQILLRPQTILVMSGLNKSKYLLRWLGLGSMSMIGVSPSNTYVCM